MSSTSLKKCISGIHCFASLLRGSFVFLLLQQKDNTAGWRCTGSLLACHHSSRPTSSLCGTMPHLFWLELLGKIMATQRQSTLVDSGSSIVHGNCSKAHCCVKPQAINSVTSLSTPSSLLSTYTTTILVQQLLLPRRQGTLQRKA